VTDMLTESELMTSSHPPQRLGRRILVATALVIPLLGVLAFLMLFFQPFADAAGSCGGG
jgi:hypothetical protein